MFPVPSDPHRDLPLVEGKEAGGFRHVATGVPSTPAIISPLSIPLFLLETRARPNPPLPAGDMKAGALIPRRETRSGLDGEQEIGQGTRRCRR